MALDTVSSSKNYDSDFCGSIPINFINSIQPHGLLMGIQKDTWKVIQVSENVTDVLDISPEQLLDQPFDTMLADKDQLERLQTRLADWPSTERMLLSLKLRCHEKSTQFSAVVHTYDKYYLVELQEASAQEAVPSLLESSQKVKKVFLALQEAENVTRIGEIAVDQIRELTGFDKVMLYRFDKQWNGTVIAEASAEEMVPYLGLRFPASDVPRQSRELYLHNPYRMIPDIHYKPARLIPIINPLTRSFTDLSACNLRAVPKVHLEYLGNMGVEASMSVPIILENKLWGLISCHHKVSNHPNVEMLTTLDLLAALISSNIASKENGEKLRHKSEVDDLKISLLEKLYTENDPVGSVLSNADDVMQLFKATGFSLVLDGKISSSGEVPNDRQINNLVVWLKRYKGEKMFFTKALPEMYEPAQAYKDISSGLIALNITQQKENYFLIYRPEVIKTVDWGGNPNEAINFEADGKTYHPRNSFKVWQETVSYTSDTWGEEEIKAADHLYTALTEKLVEPKSVN